MSNSFTSSDSVTYSESILQDKLTLPTNPNTTTIYSALPRITNEEALIHSFPLSDPLQQEQTNTEKILFNLNQGKEQIQDEQQHETIQDTRPSIPSIALLEDFQTDPSPSNIFNRNINHQPDSIHLPEIENGLSSSSSCLNEMEDGIIDIEQVDDNENENDLQVIEDTNLPWPSTSQRKPQRILQHGSLEEIAEYIQSKKAKRILVVAGAGISTAAGIPDFRSPTTGLYHNLQKYNLPEPEDIFDIDFFLENPKPFFELAKELYPTNFIPTFSHFFVKLLAEKGVLLKMMTQNIDTLETVAGIPSFFICEAHGSFSSAFCVTCQEPHDPSWVHDHIMKDTIPLCQLCNDYVKPGIVFFGEPLPSSFFECLQKVVPNTDLVLVMGTSLKVGPFNSILEHVPEHVPRLLINNVKVGELNHPSMGFDFTGTKHRYFRDVFVQGNCDDIVLRLADLLGWKEELLALRNDFKLSTKLSQIHISLDNTSRSTEDKPTGVKTD